MPEFRYARGRILESIQFISEEIREFEEEYSNHYGLTETRKRSRGS
jgi:hypothetical protein